MILAKAPVYKLRLGRPSRLPSVFINFKMDPCLCPLPKNILFLCLQVQTLDIQLHLDIHSGIHLDIHAYPSQSNSPPLSITVQQSTSPSCRFCSLSLPSVPTCLTPFQMSVACLHYECTAWIQTACNTRYKGSVFTRELRCSSVYC